MKVLITGLCLTLFIFTVTCAVFALEGGDISQFETLQLGFYGGLLGFIASLLYLFHASINAKINIEEKKRTDS